MGLLLITKLYRSAVGMSLILWHVVKNKVVLIHLQPVVLHMDAW